METNVLPLEPFCGGLSQNFMFLNDNGDLICFGENASGQCGLKDRKELLLPTFVKNNKNIKMLISGYYRSFYLEYNGDLYGCGSNSYYQIGSHSVEHEYKLIETKVKRICNGTYCTVIQKEDEKLYYVGNAFGNESKTFKEIEGISDVKRFSCGGTHIIFQKYNGEVFVMGYNSYGQIGLGYENREEIISHPKYLMKNNGIISIVCGDHYTLILTNETMGTELWCFGTNNFGQLGLNHGENQYEISKIKDFKNIKSIHCGGSHSLILLGKRN
eukprot:TRINITY_DN604_c0_g2_i2.p1 TRINITY_DN604_c0_g2~~TRINITY_DN604_c0_g2_i2.p1  ORF type:complete len:272 (-),score=49.80 TRINITY_DN604_c0_g2_i2:519-1334(-)